MSCVRVPLAAASAHYFLKAGKIDMVGDDSVNSDTGNGRTDGNGRNDADSVLYKYCHEKPYAHIKIPQRLETSTVNMHLSVACP